MGPKHADRGYNDGTCVRNFWCDMSRKVMALSAELSLAMSPGHIIMVPENKCQSMEYRHKNSPMTKNSMSSIQQKQSFRSHIVKNANTVNFEHYV